MDKYTIYGVGAGWVYTVAKGVGMEEVMSFYKAVDSGAGAFVFSDKSSICLGRKDVFKASVDEE